MDILKREGIWLLALLTGAGCTAARQPPTAREALATSLEAMGVTSEAGLDEGLAFEARGTLDQGAEHQGRYPGSLDPTPFREALAVDSSARRLGYEYEHDRFDGSKEWVRDLYEGDERTIAVLSDGVAFRLQSKDYVTERENLWRRFPHLLLRELLEGDVEPARDASGRFLLGLASGETLALSLDAETHLPRRVDYVTDLQSFGDTEVSWRFDDYRAVEGFGLLPHAYRVEVGGRTYIDMAVERATAARDERARNLSLPDGMETPELRVLPEGDASVRARVDTVAPGVHVARNLRLGFHPMFVELEDGVVVFDAPAGYRLLTQLPAGDVAPGPSSAWLSERLIELIEETVPDKPIRYVVLTHFHNDHAGGLRAFVARGVTILGSAAISEAVASLVVAPHTAAPDTLAASPRELRFEPVSGTRRLGGVELIDIGASPHSDAMLVAHLPEHRILFTSDLVGLRPFFGAWLRESGLEPEHIYSMHGGAPLEPSEFALATEQPS